MNALPSFVTILFDTRILGRGEALGLAQELKRLLSEYGIEASDGQVSLLLQHLELLNERNQITNLTRVTTEEEALITHILDSLLPLPYLQTVFSDSPISFVDIGTGGGFPGIPLAVITEWNATLVDAVGKKVTAVNDFISGMGMNDRAVAEHVRAEDLARRCPGSFDLVVTRAVAQSNVLIEYASPLLRTDGLLALYKAHPSEDEVSAAMRAAKLCGMSYVSRETFELPNNAGHRELLYYRKSSRPKIKLPRRNGLAMKEPLGL